MSAYIKLLEDAVESRDVARVRSRICNLLAEKKGLSGTEIWQKSMEIENIFKNEEMGLFDPDNIQPLSISETKFNEELSKLSISFTRSRLKALCDLKNKLYYTPDASKRHSQSGHSHQGSNKPQVYKSKTNARSSLKSKDRLYTIRGGTIGCCGGFLIGIACNHIITSMFIATAIGAAVGYATSQMGKNGR